MGRPDYAQSHCGQNNKLLRCGTWAGCVLPTPVNHGRKHDLGEIVNIFSTLRTQRMELNSFYVLDFNE